MANPRVWIHLVHGKTRLRKWRTGRLNGSDETFLELGRLPDPDGRFYVHHSRRGAAWAFGDERGACDFADRILARGGWEEQPANFGPDQMPYGDDRPWVKRGQRWVLAGD